MSVLFKDSLLNTEWVEYILTKRKISAAHLGTLGLYLGTYASAEQAADTIAGSFSSRYMYDEEK